MSTDEHEKTPGEQAVEQALDLLVYAPIGLLFEGASLLPELVTKGRNQVAMARMFGQMAVQQAGIEATKAVGKLQDQAAGVIDFLGDSVAPLSSDEPSPVAAATTAATAAATTTVKKAAAAPRKAATATKAAVSKAVDVATLAIPDYDGLSASHVVNRLAGLTPKELENVRLYELANRGRKTILSKISQLQG